MSIRPYSTLVLLLTIVLATSCVKEEPKKGCLDILAANYDADAEEDSGDCQYENTTLDIYDQGAFGSIDSYDISFLTCAGSFHIREAGDNAGEMSLVTDDEGKFFGFFNILNVHDLRYYGSSNGKVNFTARRGSDGANTDSIKVYMRGFYPETIGFCENILVSQRQTLLTSDLDDNTDQNYSFNIHDFDEVNLFNVGVMTGFEFESNPFDTVMVINQLNWTNF